MARPSRSKSEAKTRKDTHSGRDKEAQAEMCTVAKCQRAGDRLAESNLECAARTIAACAFALPPGLKFERPKAAAPKAEWTVALVELADRRTCALRMLRKMTQQIVGSGSLLPPVCVELWTSVAVGLFVKCGHEWRTRTP